MWMDVRLLDGVAKHIIEKAQQTVEALRTLSEHMFATLSGVSDGTRPVQRFLQGPRPAYNADHTSSLVRTRATTSSVNSVVPAWPPRSGVLIPAPTVSIAPS